MFITGETLWNEILNLVIGLTYLSEGIVEDKGDVEHGIKRYLGGPDYLRKSASNESTSSYLANYATTIWQEYVKLTYIYKGALSENSTDNLKTSFKVDSANKSDSTIRVDSTVSK